MATPAQPSAEATALYDRLIANTALPPEDDKEQLQPEQPQVEGFKRNFFQSDFEAFTSDPNSGSVVSASRILHLVQELQEHCLLRSSKLHAQVCWNTRPRAAAKLIHALGRDERVVYEYVEEAREKGIWIREIKRRVNLPQNLVQKTLEKLEKSRLVKSVQNVRSPVQKTYMLYHLAPSDDVTGGSFFDAGDLDESLIEELSNLIVFHVRTLSWAEIKKKHIKREIVISDDDDEINADHDNDHPATSTTAHPIKKKRRRGGPDIEDASPTKRRSHHHNPDPETHRIATPQQLAYPANSYSYPTTSQIHTWLTTSDAIRASKAQQLSVAEIQGLIDVLIWDDKLERIGEGYRSVRGVRENRHDGGGDEDEGEYGGGSGVRRAGNGLTQAPCGRCPVFDLCREGGPVSAKTCVYFAEWLGDGGG